MPGPGLSETVARGFRNVLAVHRVGLDDNFFDLGAHSLQMVKAHADLNQQIERPVPSINFFQYPNVRALAPSLSSLTRTYPNSRPKPLMSEVKQ